MQGEALERAAVMRDDITEKTLPNLSALSKDVEAGAAANDLVRRAE